MFWGSVPAVFPFSRLVHIITVPLGYLTRPFQLVKRVRRDQPVEREREPVGAGRPRRTMSAVNEMELYGLVVGPLQPVHS